MAEGLELCCKGQEKLTRPKDKGRGWRQRAGDVGIRRLRERTAGDGAVGTECRALAAKVLRLSPEALGNPGRNGWVRFSPGPAY